MKIDHLLPALAVLGFIAMMVVSKNLKRDFLLFVLYLLPVVDLPITPVEYGRLRVFDGVAYVGLIVFYKHILLRKSKFGFNVYYFLFGIFVLSVILGSINSPYISNSLMATLAIFPIFIYAKALITECLEDPGFRKKVITALQTVALFSIVFVLAQRVLGLGFTFYPALNKNTAIDDVIRYPSFFHDPQLYGQYLVMLSFLFLINHQRPARPTLTNYVFFLLILIALLETGGRSAFLGIFAGMFVLFFVFDRQYKIMLAGFTASVAVVFLFFPSSITLFSRVESAGDDYLFREALWNEASGIVKGHPILGVGLGNYGAYNVAHTKNYVIGPEKEVIFFGYGQPESGYWMMLSEIGIAGFLIFALFILTAVFNSLRAYFLGNKNIIIFIIIAAIIGWLLTFVSAYSLYDRRILIVITTLICLLIVEGSKLKAA
jgi:O-antigen ligase